jgi:hypothetical protein
MTQHCPGSASARDSRRNSAIKRWEETISAWDKALSTRKDDVGRAEAKSKLQLAKQSLTNTQANLGRGSSSLDQPRTLSAPTLSDVG